MMAKNPMYPLLRRSLASVLAVLIGLGPLATPGYAAITQLADEPLNVKNQAKPNVVLTVDDSTSMLYDFLRITSSVVTPLPVQSVCCAATAQA